MINLFLFLSLAFMIVLIAGRYLEKIRLPWVFSALLLGAALSINNPFTPILESDTFDLLAKLGMYFLLFMIGLELNLKEMKHKSGFILKAMSFTIFLGTLGGTFLIHYLFPVGWWISILVAMSFATVGEAILVPILDEFKIINTRLGQSIIGIGTVDDLIEMALLIIVIIFINTREHGRIFIIIGALLVLFILTAGLRRMESRGEQFRFKNIETLFLSIMFIFMLYLGVGQLADAAPLAALIAGISIKTFIPKNRFKLVESEIKSFAYGFFVPIFFVWVGAGIDFKFILVYPLAVLAVFLVSNGAKLLGSYLIARKVMGTKKSILLGIGLSVRFSTSIVIIKILLDYGLIDSELYSVIIASSILSVLIIPLLFSNLLVRWKEAK